ncbi:MAG: plasmid recombination protein [Scytonema hyalinum WJT4-NPBG1]|jgi:hypothetical protein|nr:plasmid recombination protein [Scytonema hyalinum WJT4-NPBG1]
MAYAIARLAKLKKGNLSGSAAHTARTRPTPNADAAKQNLRFIGSTDSEEKLEDLVQAKIDSYKQKRKIRTDAVYCVELLLTASPSYFRPDDPTNGGYYEEDKLKAWFDAAQNWLTLQYGSRIVRAELHLDEVTPHIHAYFVPLDEFGQLRCNHFFDGRQKMRAFQDSHYAAMQHLGLERGIKGSVAKHQDIKDFYRIVEEGRDLDTGELSPEQLQAKAADRDRAVKKKAEMEETTLRLVKDQELLQQRIQQLEAENQQLRNQLDQLRDLPLEDVAWQLGLTKTKDGKWKGGGHIISIDEPKWYDFAPGSQKGGGGAIDLVMYVNSCSFQKALAWLSDRFGSGGMLKAATHHARGQAQEIAQTEPIPQFTPPAADSSQWSAVQQYLIQQRGLPANMVQALHSRRFVYADSNQNAVFGMRSLTGETTGAFLRGTRGEDNSFMGYARGTKRADGWFYLRLGGKPDDDITRVVITKSPIDALSLAAIEGMPQQKTMYLVADSTKSLPVEFLQSIPTVIAAYDSDAAGDELAQAIQDLLPQTERMRPIAKDWNSELLARLRQQQKQKNRGIER